MTTIERQRRRRENLPTTYTPGLVEHMARTGEKPPAKWWRQPCDMIDHGGYVVMKDGAQVAGPFAWYENAEQAAGPLCGEVRRARVPVRAQA